MGVGVGVSGSLVGVGGGVVAVAVGPAVGGAVVGEGVAVPLSAGPGLREPHAAAVSTHRARTEAMSGARSIANRRLNG